MEVYKIITDNGLLDDFIEWLPDLEDNEKFYCSLFARKKYNDVLKQCGDRTQLRRWTTTKEHMKEKLLQLEIPVGRWKAKNISAPQDSLVVYMHPNPRNMKKANAYLGRRCWELTRADHFNLHAEAMSAVQKSRSRTIWVDFDIDSDEEIVIPYKELDHELGKKNYKVLKTRGGYHLLCNAADINAYRKSEGIKFSWYKKVQETFEVDQTGDQMIPIAGCTQGGFTPYFIN